jgi:hypothetical protein
MDHFSAIQNDTEYESLAQELESLQITNYKCKFYSNCQRSLILYLGPKNAEDLQFLGNDLNPNGKGIYVSILQCSEN